MRFRLLVGFVVSCSLASAAPVPTDPKAERARLEACWTKFHWINSSHEVARAALALKDHPGAVQFLREKLRPVKATEKQIRGWLEKLNSEMDGEWEAAYENLLFYDPQLALTVPQQLELLTTDRARSRWFHLWCRFETKHVRYFSSIELQVVKTDDQGTHLQKVVGKERSNFVKAPLAAIENREWHAIDVAVEFLAHNGSADAREVIKLIAGGHPDVSPTKRAKDRLSRTPKQKWDQKLFESYWLTLCTDDTPLCVRTVLALAGDEAAVPYFKQKLPPIKAEKKQIEHWIAELGNDSAEVAKAAYESLSFYNPLLALSIPEQIQAAETDLQRCRLFSLWRHQPWDRIELYDRMKLRYEIGESVDIVRGSYSKPGVQGTSGGFIHPIQTIDRGPWLAARLAILALERTGTPDAVAVIKQLADGHPDILPTKDAKAALERIDGAK